jgi:hypothetical protein
VRLRARRPFSRVHAGDLEDVELDARASGHQAPLAAKWVASRARLALAGLAASTLLLFVRSVYRTAELSDGWNGRIIQTQSYFSTCPLARHSRRALTPVQTGLTAR